MSHGAEARRMRGGPDAAAVTGPAPVPALRDVHGQDWPWPPVAPGERGAWIVFLPGAFTPVCTSELGWLGPLAVELAEAGVGVRVVSCDAAPVLREVADRLALPEACVLLSDFWPHGAAAASFGLLDGATGRPRRVSVLVDPAGVERARVTAAPGAGRTAAEHREDLAVLWPGTAGPGR